MRYLVMIVLLQGAALAQQEDVLAPEGMEQKPTVHPITAEARRQTPSPLLQGHEAGRAHQGCGGEVAARTARREGVRAELEGVIHPLVALLFVAQRGRHHRGQPVPRGADRGAPTGLAQA